MNTVSLLRWIAGALLVLPLGLSACAPTHTDLCERAADCGGGRDPEIEACITSMDAREDQAEIFSCEKEWDRHVECLDEDGTCVDDELAGCDASRDALNECIGSRRSGHASIQLKSAE